MSRFQGYNDDYSPEAILAAGRWQRNARATLKSRRGQAALALIREALLALPGKRLIEGAMCTIGGPERVCDVTDAEIDAYIARRQEKGLWHDYDTRERVAGWLQSDREEERDAVDRNRDLKGQGCGVCVNGALLWHLNVKAGMTSDAAFAALPSVAWADGASHEETARIAEKDAGLAYTLAWELVFRNDETYRKLTPEERYEAFLDWINAELGEPVGSAA